MFQPATKQTLEPDFKGGDFTLPHLLYSRNMAITLELKSEQEREAFLRALADPILHLADEAPPTSPPIAPSEIQPSELPSPISQEPEMTPPQESPSSSEILSEPQTMEVNPLASDSGTGVNTSNQPAPDPPAPVVKTPPKSITKDVVNPIATQRTRRWTRDMFISPKDE